MMACRAVCEQDKIRILHCIETWLPRTENWIYNHIQSHTAAIETHVICQWSQNAGEFPIENLYSAALPPEESRLIRKVLFRLGLHEDSRRHLPLMEEILRKVRPDIVHSHFGHVGAVNAPLAERYSIPHVVSFYGLDVGYLPTIQHRWKRRYRKMGKSVAMVLCEGPYMADRIAQLGIPRDKIRVFRLGIDLRRIPFRPRTNPLPGKVRVLIAGTFREKKGIPHALEALGLLSKKYAFAITVIGDAGRSKREQDEKSAIHQVVKRWGLDDQIRFLGYQPHPVLIEEFYRHEIFLSPSVIAADGDSEGGAPVTVIEAAASGMPVISTHHCDIPFVLSEQNRPYLVPERDAVALSQAIEALLHCESWNSIAVANRRLIKQELDCRKQSRKLAEIYMDTAARLTAAVK